MESHLPGDPVDRELRRRHLAQRLTAHHARTGTIFHLTGLSRHQLATMRQRWRIPNEMRRRGPPPTSFAVLRSTLRTRDEAAALAVQWKVLAGVDAERSPHPKATSNVEMGERLCEVIESHLACFPHSELELEHLILLTQGLAEADAIALSACGSCEGVILADLLERRRHLCSHCQRVSDAVALPSQSDKNGEPSRPAAGNGEAVQQELF